MARNAIVLSSVPKGRSFEGTLTSGQTPKPGQCVKLVSAGTWSVGVADGADGGIGPITIVTEDVYNGKTSLDAYADGAHVFLYNPGPGDELNLMRADIAGTGDDQAIGDLLMIQNSSGKLIANSSGKRVFQALEAIVNPTADQLTMVLFS